ncbi:unnamed protein product [Thelazia callipaeda]|uniref:SH2 domain-containing protein n=1 Tax=Thelazia callipaeda TaxID=103827 RepID=A0A0N5D843_THECL|nr:unnamed protein product [Thelazia callipaeda]
MKEDEKKCRENKENTEKDGEKGEEESLHNSPHNSQEQEEEQEEDKVMAKNETENLREHVKRDKDNMSRESIRMEGSAGKDIEELPEEVDTLPFYHGFITPEDLCFIFSEVGDFIIRLMQSSKTKKFAIVLSVETKHKPLKIKHIRLHHVRSKDNKIQWYASEKYKYGSIKELTSDYIKQKRPIHPDIPESVLIRGIRLKNWEIRHSDVKFGKLLGQGQFASVYQGEINSKSGKKEIAIKKVAYMILHLFSH